MKKLRFFKALFVAAALALVIPGCSGVDSDEGTNTPQTQGNKVALKISASEGYRTALPTVDLSSYTYELTADVMTENTPAENPTSLIPAGTSYTNLTKANSVYVEADKTYLFTLTATNGDSGDILSGTVTKQITTSDSTLSFQLFAIDSTSDTGSVSIEVTYDDGYGVASVIPMLYKTDGTSLAETYPLTYTAGGTVGTGTITGSVPVGASYVEIVLKDESSTEIGSIPQEAVYAVKGLTSSSAVNIQVKRYKATIDLTTSDDSAPTLTLKNPAITTEGYAGISTSGEGTPFTVTKAGDSVPYTYTYTGDVPTAAYDVYKGATKIGTVQNVNALELNESVTLESIAVAWKDGTAPTLYVGTTEAQLRAALTVTATLSSGTNTVTEYTISDFDSTATTEQTVTVSYTYNGVTKTDTIAVTLVAAVTTCTVTFVKNAENASITVTTQSIPSGTATALTSATVLGLSYNGYTFSGWATSDNSTTVAYADGAEITITEDTMLYAVWTSLSLKAADYTALPSNLVISPFFTIGSAISYSTDNSIKNFKTGGAVTSTGKNIEVTVTQAATITITWFCTSDSRTSNVVAKSGTSVTPIATRVTDSNSVEKKTTYTDIWTVSGAGTYLVGGTNGICITEISIEITSTITKKDLATSTAPTAAYTLTDSSSYKGDAATVTLPSVSVPTTEVTVSGETTTVEGTWTWCDTSVDIATTDWTDGTATVTAKATFTPIDTNSYNTLAAQDVTITVTDERVEASTEVEVTAGKIYYWDLISDVASDSTATATVEDFVNGLKLAVAGGYTVDANYGLQLSANTTFTFPVVSNSRIVAYLTYTGGGAKEIALSVGESALDSVSLNVGDCKAANGPVPVAWAYTGAAGTAVLTVPANVRIAKIVLDTTVIAADSFAGATYTFTSDSNWVAYSGEKISAKTYYPHLLSGTAGASNIFWYGTNGLAVFNGGADGLKTQPNSGNCPVYLTVPVYGACTITVVSSTLDNAPVIYNGGTTVATMTADSQTSTTYSATCKGLTGLNVLSIAIPSANASGTKTQQKIQSISITEASNTTPVTISLTAVGSSDITLAYSNGTLTASAVSGATVAETGYKWYIDNALQSDATSATLNVSALTSGIHSIVVEATDSSTGVTYAAQYVLTVN